MSDTEDHLTSKERQDTTGPDVSSTPPSYQEQQPPPYSAAPEMYPPAKIQTTCTYQPTSGYESFRDINPEALSDTTPLIASSSFDDRTVRMGFVRKVCATKVSLLAVYFRNICIIFFLFFLFFCEIYLSSNLDKDSGGCR